MTQADGSGKAAGGASESGTGGGGGVGAGPTAGLGLAQANFGPKYEAHLAALQKSLDEAQARADSLEKQLKEIT